MNSAERKILDLGIGAGGSYITRDAPGVKRIGLDENPYALEEVKKSFRIPVVVGDAYLTERTFLPLRTGVFDQVDAIFPFGGLLMGLAYSEKLWHELKRILKRNGTVKVLIDIPFLNVQLNTVNGERVLMDYPQGAVYNQAKSRGFRTSMREVDRDEVRALGTIFSEGNANWQGIMFGKSVYEITAVKVRKRNSRIQPVCDERSEKIYPKKK